MYVPREIWMEKFQTSEAQLTLGYEASSLKTDSV